LRDFFAIRTVSRNKDERGCAGSAGRPTLYEGSEGKGAPLIGVRLPPDELAAVDDWLSRESEPLSRPEAIRRLIKIALKKPRKS
jgi:hypothetical protein